MQTGNNGYWPWKKSCAFWDVLVLALAQLLLWRQASLFLLPFPVWIAFSFKFQCSGDTKWWLFADDLASSMQAAGNCGNPLAIKGFVLQFLRFNRFSSSYLKTVWLEVAGELSTVLLGLSPLLFRKWPQIHDSHDLGFFSEFSFHFYFFPHFYFLPLYLFLWVFSVIYVLLAS